VVQQPVTQRQSPGFGPVIDGMARQHLRLCVTISVEREQRIKHHHHVFPGDEGADQRVEQRKIGIWDEFQGGGGGGARDPGPGQARGANYSGSVAEKLASFHPTCPIRPATHIGHSPGDGAFPPVLADDRRRSTLSTMFWFDRRAAGNAVMV